MNNSNSSNNSNNDRLDSNTNLSTTTSQHTTTDNLFYLKFSRACACADTREDAKAEADRLQDNFKLMNLATGTVNAKFKEMPIADQLLFAIYIRYPELQTAFSFPLLEWQAQKLTSGYFPEYINRALEQISNKLDDTAAKNRQLYMAIKKFIDMDYIRNQKR